MKKQFKMLALILAFCMTAALAASCGTTPSAGGGSQVTVSFNLSGGDAADRPPQSAMPAVPDSITVTVGEAYGSGLPVPAATGYLFKGWYSGNSAFSTLVTAETVVTNGSDHTLHARWEQVGILVKLDLQGGKFSNLPSGIVEIEGEPYANIGFGKPYGFLGEPVKAGWIFEGWYTAAEGGEPVVSSALVTGPHTVYARYKNSLDFSDDADLDYFQALFSEPALSIDGGRMKVSGGSPKADAGNKIRALIQTVIPIPAVGMQYEFTVDLANPSMVEEFEIFQIFDAAYDVRLGTYGAPMSSVAWPHTFKCPVTAGSTEKLMIQAIYNINAASADTVFYISNFKVTERFDTNKTEWNFDSEDDLNYFQTPYWWSGKIDYSIDGSNGRMKVSGGSPRSDSRQQALLEFALPPPPVGKQYEVTVEFANPSMVDEFEISQNEAWPFDTSTGYIFGLYGAPMSSVSWPHTFTCLVTANSTDNLRFNVIYKLSASSSDMVFYISNFKIV